MLCFVMFLLFVPLTEPRYYSVNGSQQREGNPPGDDQFNEAITLNLAGLA